ncbi:MAG: Ribosomal large subunit pseudouridine synthase E (EC [uncultured Aureispira sp.]|uniref:Pseudouridine synthase n=1 Tax=uncultured Aureispira sp. TaxID=1331704 RepID=A0A6S6UEM5_9BACT|nr:MAG: Ribosomal large subunit pseudouridine synthase E (EC [uncultured Aureispira sp.]
MTLKYYVIYKPFGMLSQFSKEEASNVTLADLKMTFDKDIYPVGRLDKDSEGLLILTNDKKLTDTLLKPENKHWRTYWVQVEKVPTENALRHLRKGVLIKLKKRAYKTKPAKAELLTSPPRLPERTPPIRFRKEIPTAWLEISLREGKNRQVRRMTANVGFPTLRLVRHNIVDLTIGNMVPGQIKSLEAAEIYKLLQLDKVR